MLDAPKEAWVLAIEGHAQLGESGTGGRGNRALVDLKAMRNGARPKAFRATGGARQGRACPSWLGNNSK
jgi:hypothetical protein